jgi:hypothetical protein
MAGRVHASAPFIITTSMMQKAYWKKQGACTPTQYKIYLCDEDWRVHACQSFHQKGYEYASCKHAPTRHHHKKIFGYTYCFSWDNYVQPYHHALCVM